MGLSFKRYTILKALLQILWVSFSETGLVREITPAKFNKIAKNVHSSYNGMLLVKPGEGKLGKHAGFLSPEVLGRSEDGKKNYVPAANLSTELKKDVQYPEQPTTEPVSRQTSETLMESNSENYQAPQDVGLNWGFPDEEVSPNLEYQELQDVGLNWGSLDEENHPSLEYQQPQDVHLKLELPDEEPAAILIKEDPSIFDNQLDDQTDIQDLYNSNLLSGQGGNIPTRSLNIQQGSLYNNHQHYIQQPNQHYYRNYHAHGAGFGSYINPNHRNYYTQQTSIRPSIIIRPQNYYTPTTRLIPSTNNVHGSHYTRPSTLIHSINSLNTIGRGHHMGTGIGNTYRRPHINHLRRGQNYIQRNQNAIHASHSNHFPAQNGYSQKNQYQSQPQTQNQMQYDCNPMMQCDSSCCQQSSYLPTSSYGGYGNYQGHYNCDYGMGQQCSQYNPMCCSYSPYKRALKSGRRRIFRNK